MDIFCPTCGKTWDKLHLAHDEIKNTSLKLDEINVFNGKLNAKTVAALEKHGWKFKGESILHFERCPFCPPESSISEDRPSKRA